jgi:Cys-tRNA(Pro)/Cys-tRNA(Cys) deacylase
MQKTIAIKLLEGKKIKHEVVSYPDHMRDAEAIAVELNVPAGQVFKTLVVLPPGTTGRAARPLLVMLPADRQLNLKKLAKAVGAKKLQMATHAEAEKMTGLQVGGISALALINRGFSIYLDELARTYEQIFVSAGQRGVDIKLAVTDLIRVTGARFVDAGE